MSTGLLRVLAVWGASLLLLVHGGVSAADDAPPRNSVYLAPYAWAPDLKGSVGFGPQKVPLDIDVRELASGVNAAAMGYAQVSRDRHFLYIEGLGFRFKDEKFAPFFDQNVKAEVSLAEAGYGRHFSFETSYPAQGTTVASPYIGVRHVRLKADVRNPRQSLKANENWVDPTLGVIVIGPLYRRFDYGLKLDAAGFGLGRDHYWSSITAVQYRFGKAWALGAGYRVSRFSARPGGDNDLELNLRGSGPEAGLTYTFRY